MESPPLKTAQRIRLPPHINHRRALRLRGTNKLVMQVAGQDHIFALAVSVTRHAVCGPPYALADLFRQYALRHPALGRPDPFCKPELTY
jgi:hypothetical protein